MPVRIQSLQSEELNSGAANKNAFKHKEAHDVKRLNTRIRLILSRPNKHKKKYIHSKSFGSVIRANTLNSLVVGTPSARLRMALGPSCRNEE